MKKMAILITVLALLLVLATAALAQDGDMHHCHWESGLAFGEHHAEHAQAGELGGEHNPGHHQGYSICVP